MSKKQEYIDGFVKSQKEIWFSDHKAELKILDENTHQIIWSENGNTAYYMKFIISGRNIFISGDVGSAVYTLTWFPKPYEDWSDTSLDYLTGKLTAYGNGSGTSVNSFDDEVAIEDLMFHSNEYNEDTIQNILSELDNESIRFPLDWIHFVHEHKDMFEDLDGEYYEWASSVGQVPDSRVIAYHTALRMATDQLRVQKELELHG